MSGLDLLSAVLIIGGLFFFTAGTAGLLRFPDLSSRLHAITKADTLGLILAGVAVQAGDPWTMAKLAVVWLFALVAAAVAATALAGQDGAPPLVPARPIGSTCCSVRRCCSPRRWRSRCVTDSPRSSPS